MYFQFHRFRKRVGWRGGVGRIEVGKLHWGSGRDWTGLDRSFFSFFFFLFHFSFSFSPSVCDNLFDSVAGSSMGHVNVNASGDSVHV